MEIFLLRSATGTAVRQTLAGTGSYEVEGGTVVSLYVVLYDFVLVFATKRFGICNKRSLDITKTNTEIGSLSWPVAMDSMCDISLLLSIAHGCLALPDASSISVRISIAKSVRNRLRTCLQPHGRLSHSHCSPPKSFIFWVGPIFDGAWSERDTHWGHVIRGGRMRTIVGITTCITPCRSLRLVFGKSIQTVRMQRRGYHALKE